MTALGHLELTEEQILHFAASDIEDCFHHFELPREMQELFGMPPIEARFLGLRSVENVKIDPITEIFPLVTTVPMGFSWSMFWCQQAHEHCLDREAAQNPVSDLGLARRIRERHPFPGWTSEAASAAPCREVFGLGTAEQGRARRSGRPAPSRCLNLVYADNNGIFGLSRPKVKRSFEELRRSLARAKLPLHELVHPTVKGELLGVEIDGCRGRIRPSLRRVWRVRQAFAYLAQGPRISGEDLWY